MKPLKITSIFFVLLVTVLAFSLAWAKSDRDNEALALAKTKISLTQAIDNALAAVPGQALSAEFDTEDNQPVFVVEVVDKGQTFEVMLDSQNGSVIGKKLDKPDRDKDAEDRD